MVLLRADGGMSEQRIGSFDWKRSQKCLLPRFPRWGVVPSPRHFRVCLGIAPFTKGIDQTGIPARREDAAPPAMFRRCLAGELEHRYYFEMASIGRKRIAFRPDQLNPFAVLFSATRSGKCKAPSGREVSNRADAITHLRSYRRLLI